MEPQPSISVVECLWNGDTVAPECLEHLNDDRHVLRYREYPSQVTGQCALSQTSAGSEGLLPPTTTQSIAGGSLELLWCQGSDPRRGLHGSFLPLNRSRLLYCCALFGFFNALLPCVSSRHASSIPVKVEYPSQWVTIYSSRRVDDNL